MSNSVPFTPNSALLCSATTKTEFGARATSSPPSFIRTLFGSSPAWLLPTVVHCVKAIVGTCSAKVFYLLMRSPSFVLPAAIPRQPLMSTGYLKGYCMGCAAARSTGMKKLTQFFIRLGSPPHSKTRAFTLAKFATLPIIPSHYPRHLFPPESMSTTRLLFARSRRSKNCSVIFSRNAENLTLWGLLNGF